MPMYYIKAEIHYVKGKDGQIEEKTLYVCDRHACAECNNPNCYLTSNKEFARRYAPFEK